MSINDPGSGTIFDTRARARMLERIAALTPVLQFKHLDHHLRQFGV